ncbi:hypothetical protein [Cellulomonas taurus]|uniref:hypothetical protein n=1 Tax=Cellulomonas taurus TaxID=2729175 RepID=UPI00145F0C6A|nr:hypothetical protein [Cellulomonas taurus]
MLDFVDAAATATPSQATPAPVARRRAATAAAEPHLPRYAGNDDNARAAIAMLRAAQAVAS